MNSYVGITRTPTGASCRAAIGSRAYNGLIESWREIVKIRDGLPDETPPTGPAQAELLI